jgi:glycosyltransferase involved in cell wall biosynthesis
MKRQALFLTGEMGLGGGAMFVLNLCEGLRLLDGNWSGVAGVFSSLGSIGQQTLAAGHPVVGPFPEACIHEDAMAAMHQACASLRPDAVVANLGGDAYDFMRFVPEGVLRIGMIHSDYEHVYRLVESYSAWLDIVVAVSRHSADLFRHRNPGTQLAVTHITCGIPISTESRLPEDGVLRVLYLGRLEEEQKRVSMMTRIIRESVTRDPRIRWTLVGDGPQGGEMRAALGNMPGVTFTGALPYAEARAAIPSHDVYFLCSDYEGLPLSMLEAMSSGLVPVVSDLPSGISEVVNDENGVRVNIADEQGYIEALLALASCPERLKSLSQHACRDVAGDYSLTAMGARWSALLDAHAKARMAPWDVRTDFDLPPISKKSWIHRPVFRPLRRRLKGLGLAPSKSRT